MTWMLTLAPSLLALLAHIPQHERGGTLRLVESFPVETTLDAPDLPQTADVWLELIQGAKREIVLSYFYAATAEGSSLNQVVDALERAAARGVEVRLLLSSAFEKTYPKVPARLASLDGVTVRFIDFKELGGGVAHAKYLIVDSASAFLGSQNFDFRAMDQIQELGVLFHDQKTASILRGLFELDWRAAGHEPPAELVDGGSRVDSWMQLDPAQAGAEDPATSVTLCGSPRGWLPEGITWDLPLIVDLIDSARASVRAQVLTYDATGKYDPGYFHQIENALRSAAARGVHVQLLVADWCKREGVIDGLQSLAALDHIDVSFVVIPEWSEGFVPFSRVAHAKLCVADERAAWVGTSNWERSYFTQSRNVGVILEGKAAASRIARWFDSTWNSEYREPVIPGKTYKAPRRR